jgi:AraC-like DNA-binding protein
MDAPAALFEFVSTCQRFACAWSVDSWAHRAECLCDCIASAPRRVDALTLPGLAYAMSSVASRLPAQPIVTRAVSVHHNHHEAALRVIAGRYADETLRLQSVASMLDLTPDYISRLLVKRTRYHFASHLHAFRVTKAVALLCHTRLSVKEIAAAVGYPWTSELDRHFGVRLHCTPSAFRGAYRQLSTLMPTVCSSHKECA